MAYEYTGIVEEVLPVQTFNKGFRKQVLVIGEDEGFEGKYPSHNPFEFKGEHVGLLTGIRKGQRVKVTFGLDGRKWDDGKGGVRYFPTCSAFKVALLSGDVGTTSCAAPAPVEKDPELSADDDDMPF